MIPIRIQPNFSEAVNFGATVPGMYKLQVRGSKLEKIKKGKNVGSYIINWSFLVVEPIQAGEGAEHEKGRTVLRRTPITGAGAGFLQELLKALSRDDLVESEAGWDTEELHGEYLGGVLSNRGYKDDVTGEDRVSVDITRFFPVAK